MSAIDEHKRKSAPAVGAAEGTKKNKPKNKITNDGSVVNMNFGFSTVEAGAGSYPEPPDIPETNPRECSECFETSALKMTDGKLLCPHCRAEYLFDNSSYKERIAFIESGSVGEQLDFFENWYFKELGSSSRLKLLKKVFHSVVSADLRELLVDTYVRELKGDFADYTERMKRNAV